jgi:exonuclease III
MKLVSWNVNSLRACVKKGFNDYFSVIMFFNYLQGINGVLS